MSKLANFPMARITTGNTGWKSALPEKINPEVVVAKAGTVIICPKCNATIGRLYSDLFSGVSVRADQIEFSSGQKKHPNQKAECGVCKEGYMKQHIWVRPGLPASVKTLVSIAINGVQRWI